MEAVLHKNLHALSEVNFALAERLCLPVRSSHLRFEEHGGASLKLNQTRLRIELAQEEVARAFQQFEARSQLLVLGIGMGELVSHGIDRATASTVRAWDRDPWLLRLFLMRRDYSSELRSKQLQLLLGTDLLAVDISRYPTVVHPVLAAVYHMELEAMRVGTAVSQRVGLCTGGLFVDELASSFRERGLVPWPLDIVGLSQEELSLAVNALDPVFLAAINYSEGLSEFSAKHKTSLLCWEVDPAASRPRPAPVDTARTHLFLHRKKNVDLFRNAGYCNVSYLPLAAEPRLRRPVALSEQEVSNYGCAVSFVGSSLLGNSKKLLQQFIDAYCSWVHHAGDAEQAARALAANALALQAEAESDYILPAALDSLAPGFMKATLAKPERQDPAVLLAETASWQRRSKILNAIDVNGLDLWGDDGWKELERPGARYRGRAGHREELTRIYNASAINLDLGRLTQNDIVTMRVFDILACGAFVIAENNPALEELFDIGAEVESFSTHGELVSKIGFYLAHPAKAAAIADRGKQAVLTRHTIGHRVETMLSALAPADQVCAQITD